MKLAKRIWVDRCHSDSRKQIAKASYFQLVLHFVSFFIFILFISAILRVFFIVVCIPTSTISLKREKKAWDDGIVAFIFRNALCYYHYFDMLNVIFVRKAFSRSLFVCLSGFFRVTIRMSFNRYYLWMRKIDWQFTFCFEKIPSSIIQFVRVCCLQKCVCAFVYAIERKKERERERRIHLNAIIMLSIIFYHSTIAFNITHCAPRHLSRRAYSLTHLRQYSQAKIEIITTALMTKKWKKSRQKQYGRYGIYRAIAFCWCRMCYCCWFWWCRFVVVGYSSKMTHDHAEERERNC